MKPDLCIVMPVYNEEMAITGVLRSWTQMLGSLDVNYQIHVYNDGSKDSTAEMIKKICEENKKIVLHDKKNSGHGPTIIQGYQESLREQPSWILQIDSDDEIAAAEFTQFWPKRDQFDFIIGHRYNRHSPWPRKIMSLMAKAIVKVLYGKTLKDINCPFRLMKTTSFEPILSTLPVNSFAPNVMVSGQAISKNLKISEVPVKFIYRRTGEVSIKKFKLFKVALQSFMQTLTHRYFQK